MEDDVLYKIVPKNEALLNENSHHCKDPVNELPLSPKGFGTRHTQALLLFIALTIGFTMRANLSVSMVAMIKQNNHNSHSIKIYYSNNTGTNLSTAHETNNLNNQISMWNMNRQYDWNKSTQEMIVFSFFVGYTIMQIPMGMLAQKIGGKTPILIALAVNGVISLVTPWLPIIGGWLAICTGRLIQGMTQAAFYPSIHTLLAKWAPLSERGRISTYVYTGSQLGTIIIFQVSGLFAGIPSLGWPATFWFSGVLSIACFGLLACFGAASPHEHPRISCEEMAFILEGGSADIMPKKRRTPWKHILTSKAVWALIASHAGSSTGYILVLTQIPTYMNFVLGVEIKKNGLLSSLPYIAMYLISLVFGWLADYTVNKKILSIVNIRRVANTIGLVVSGIFLIGFSYITSTSFAVVMLIITLALHSGIQVGFHINHIDLAPNFAGNIMALGNMLANLTSLIVPVIVSNVVRDDLKNQQRWQTVFWMFAGLQIVTNTIFVIFCQGTVQEWNFYGEDELDTVNRKYSTEKKYSQNDKSV